MDNEDFDFPTIESGESSTPVYDKSTDMMIEPGGTKREPSWLENVQATVKEKQLKHDPVARLKDRVERNGGTMAQVDYDHEQLFSRRNDPQAQTRYVAQRNGLDWPEISSQATHASPEQAAQWAAYSEQQKMFDTQMRTAVDQFEVNHPEEKGETPLRKDMAKIFLELDYNKPIGQQHKKFHGVESPSGLVERIYQLALAETPKAKALRYIERQLARNDAVVISRKADKATV